MDAEQVQAARRAARRDGVCLLAALLRLRALDEQALVDLLARRLGVTPLDLRRQPVEGDALREVPRDLAAARWLLPLAVEQGEPRPTLRLAMADPLDHAAIDEIESATGGRVEPCLAAASDIAAAVERHYRGVTTRLIPRRPASPTVNEAVAPLPATTPAPLELRFQALYEALVHRGVLDERDFAAILDRLRR